MQPQEDQPWELYYDAMEYLQAGTTSYAHTLLNKALKADPRFVAAHVGKAAAFERSGNIRQRDKHAQLGFQATKKRFPSWPKELPWGILENRQYLRAIASYAGTLNEEGYHENALELYLVILRLNPNDNQGIRYLVAAMYAGFLPQITDVLTDVGNYLQDWTAMEKLLEKTNKEHHFWIEPK